MEVTTFLLLLEKFMRMLHNILMCYLYMHGYNYIFTVPEPL